MSGGVSVTLPEMTDELAQAVESGTLDKKTAEKLARLTPGSYCTHKSWGFGRVAEWNLIAGQVLIDFKSKKNHPMQAVYAAETLAPIPADHILVKRETDLDGIRALAKSDSSALVAKILADFGGKASSDQIASALTPEVFDVAGFKRWWDAARKKIKSDGHFGMPAKKTDPYVLLETPVNSGTRLLDGFRAARHTRDQILALEEISKSLDDLTGSEDELQALIVQIEEAAHRARRLQPSAAIEILIARDDVLEKFKSLQAGAEAPTIANIIASEPGKLGQILESIPGSKEKRVLEALEPAFGEVWGDKAIELLPTAGARLIADICRLFEKHKRKEQFQSIVEKWISERSISSEMLIWLCKERDKRFPALFNAELLAAVFSALEADLLAEKRTSRLKDLLIDDGELIGDLLIGASRDVVRDSMRKLMLTPAIEDLSKRSLMARIVKLYPDTQSMITGAHQDDEKADNLVVSWASLEKRKAELDLLITKEIPQNLRDINIAKEQGDLRENAGFKAAKEHQRVLQRRRAEMEHDLVTARGTNFESPSTTQVSIGTVVTIQNEDGSQETFSILGAWDSSPDLGIVSYKAGVGQALLGAASGSTLDLPAEHGTRKVTIKSISAFTDLELLRSTVHLMPKGAPESN
jgi:transcription elongation GreA/GreB family factor